VVPCGKYRSSPFEFISYFHGSIKKALAKRLTIIVMLLCSLAATSQTFEGARASGLAGTTVTLGDVWSTFHNQAGLTDITGFQAGVYYMNRFAVKELGDKGLSVAGKLGNGVIAGSYQSFGFSDFSQSKSGLAYALPLNDKFSIGVQINFHNTRIAEYGSSSAFSVEGGFIYKLNNKLILAAHIENPTRAKQAEYLDTRYPSIIRAGATYIFSDKVSLIGQVQQDTEQKVIGSGALEYNILETIVIRAGVSSNPTLSSFGFGYKSKYFRADIATSYHSVLGFSPQLSLVYALNGF
jgi:hypothetical protein